MLKYYIRLFVTSAAVFVSVSSYAQEVAQAGPRIELRANYETPTVSSLNNKGDIYKLGSAVAFGGELGYDFALGSKVVAGPYLTYELSTVESCAGGFCLRAKDNLAAGGHIGYVLSERSMVYGKVGYAQMTLELEGPGLKVDETGKGVEFALGYEHRFGKVFYGRIEGGYADNGKIFGLNFQRRHFGVALGANF